MNRAQNVKRFVMLDQEIGRHEHDAEQGRWEQARLAVEAVDGDGMIQAEYAHAVGKSAVHISRLRHIWKKWGGDLIAIKSRPTFTDAYRMAMTHTDDVGTSLERRRSQSPYSPPSTQEKAVERLTEDLLADPKVAKEAVRRAVERTSPAQRAIAAAVAEREMERRAEKVARQEAKAQREAMPLPAYVAKMILKFNDWALELDGLDADIARLVEEGYDLTALANAAEHLANAAEGWVKTIRRPRLRQVIDVK